MKIDNEIERSRKRIALIESQNERFKKLLESAVEFTKKSTSTTHLQEDENGFWQEAIKIIEDEKRQMKEDLNLLVNESENESEVSFTVKKLETENIELQKKVELLLQQMKIQTKDIEKIKTELTEFKFLLAQPDTNSQWLKNIFILDGSVTENASALLLEERFKLQKKIVNLERKKTELLTAIESIANPENERKIASANIKSELEKALCKAIDEVAKREFESLHLKVLELEEERSKLLSDLQSVLDNSRREIAEEYNALQHKIMQIEKQKDELKITLKTLDGPDDDNEEEVENILDAFSNKPRIMNNNKFGIDGLQGTTETRRQFTVSLPACTLL